MMDPITNTFRGDFVIVHEYDPEKELMKLPEGTQIFPPGSMPKHQQIVVVIDNRVIVEDKAERV